MSRSYTRETVLKTIFQLDFYENEQIEKYTDFIKEFNLKETDFQYAKELIVNIYEKKDKIDLLINKYLVKWDVKRINAMELAILRLAVFEILYIETIPVPVSINEAINFTVKYSDSESVKYINAVLEKIAKETVH
ncbi:MAG: transcription antitermination factor NusB [Eubacteriales bacterium]